MNHALIFSVNSWHLTRNHGAHKIATWLRSNDWDVEVIDYAGYWPEEQLLNLIDNRVTDNTVFIGFSDTWGIKRNDSKKFQKVLDSAKSKNSRIKSILGSQNISTSSIQADYYIEGYAENALLEVIKHILGTNTKPLLYSLYRNGKLVRGSDYPSIFMDNLFVKYEKRDFINSNEQLGIELSRGCKFQCDFCNYFPLGIKGDNFRTVNDYIDDLKYLYEVHGITTFYCADSTMNVSPEKLKMYADSTNKLDFNPWICGFTRADLLISNPDSWDSMIGMGYLGHHYGIETFHHAAGKSVGKGMNPEKLKQGLLELKNYFKNYKYRTSISLIYGLPYESHDSIVSGIDWIFDNLPDSHLVVYPLFIPHPKLSDQSEKSLFSESHTKYGYTDASPDSLPMDWFDGLNWKNDISGTSYIMAKEFVETDDRLVHRELSRTPWLIGELCQLTDLSFDDAFHLKLSRNKAYTLYRKKFKTILQSYITQKLNF